MADALSERVAAAHAPALYNDDDDEYEYEYSTTETETHLITLDLSLPEFVHRDDDMVVHNTRGGFRSWLNPINLDAGDNAAAKEPKKVEPSQLPRDIQVLDLHSEPLIAYRGMLFRGAWADTIGTEMLFAEGDSLQQNQANQTTKKRKSELVGAASARITCSPVELRDYKATERAAAMKRARKRLGFVIPVANGATAQRQRQGAFLESLMAVKHRKSEGDVVTVLAVDTKINTVHDDAEEVKRQQRPSIAKRAVRIREEENGNDNDNENDNENDDIQEDNNDDEQEDVDEDGVEESPQRKKARNDGKPQTRPSKGKARQ